MTEDCKRHFRQKVRDIITKLIRKFGLETVTAMVPASDVVMHKRLKNIRKIEVRKQKVKEQKKANLDDSQADDDFSTKRKPKTYVNKKKTITLKKLVASNFERSF